MSNPKPQNLANHRSSDPLFHYVLALVLLGNLAFAVYHAARHFGAVSLWMIVVCLASFVLYFKIRMYPLKVQDRVIRLEERLRLQALAPAEFHPRIAELGVDQLIALRFASDEEVVELAQKVLAEHWTRQQIKENIKNWRADFQRI